MKNADFPGGTKASLLKNIVNRYTFIFLALSVLIVLPSFGVGPIVEVLLFALISIAGVSIAAQKRFHFTTALCLSISWLLLAGITVGTQGPPALEIATGILGVLFLGYTIYLILAHLLSAHEVDADILVGACATYLMLGILWSFLYSIIMAYYPMAFGEVRPGNNLLIYYSFTTLTTLGYGDISPQVPIARTAAVLEAIMGVLYTTLLMARLVGVYLAGLIGKR